MVLLASKPSGEILVCFSNKEKKEGRRGYDPLILLSPLLKNWNDETRSVASLIVIYASNKPNRDI